MTVTQYQRDQIADLWWNGSTSPHIAKEVGVTRNTVMGLVTRAKLQRSPNAPLATHKRGGNFRRNRKPPSAAHNGNVPDEVHRPQPVQHASEPHSAFGTCKWPVGDNLLEDGFFCGQPAKRGYYCQHHGAIAYNNPLNRKAYV